MDIKQRNEDVERFQYATQGSYDKYLNIAYGVDDNYSHYMLVSMASICEYNSRVIFHIITNGLSLRSINDIRMFAQQNKVTINIYTKRINGQKLPIVNEGITLGTYLRFFLPELLSGINRILYIDADILCAGNIEELVDFDMGDKAIAAVIDIKKMQKRKIAFNISVTAHYVNAGVLLIDVNKWREMDILNNVFDTISKYKEQIKFEDQDILNILFQNQIAYLPVMYNRIDLRMKDVAEAKLLHFAAHPKPWNRYWCLNPNCNEYTKNIYDVYERNIGIKDKEKTNVKHLLRWILKYLAYKIGIVSNRQQVY